MKFSGVTILQGVEFSIFLSIFEWALQQTPVSTKNHVLEGDRDLPQEGERFKVEWVPWGNMVNISCVITAERGITNVKLLASRSLKILVLCHPLGDLGVTHSGLYMARWKARCRLPLSDVTHNFL